MVYTFIFKICAVWSELLEVNHILYNLVDDMFNKSRQILSNIYIFQFFFQLCIEIEVYFLNWSEVKS